MSIIRPPSLPPLYSNKSPRAKIPNEKYLVDLDHFKIVQNNLKKGSLGSVNIICYKKNNEILASKTSYFPINEQNKPFISREIRSLISIQHPTLIPYRGFSYNDFNGQNNITILMNYIKNIPLSEMIDNNILSSSFDNTKRQIILVGIARGMMILHKHHILHQDLKAENVLLDKHYQPVITDFGLTKIFNPLNSPIQIQNPYLAPEVISGSKFNSKSDVFSFGILMFEILTGKRANSSQNLEQRRNINEASEDGFYLEFPSNCTIKKGLKTIVEKCLSKSPSNRPTFSELFRKLSLLQNDSEENDVICENENSGQIGSLEFCLEKVDLEKLFSYVERIIDETPLDKKRNERKMINEEMNVLKMHNKEMKRKIRELEKENEMLKNEIFQLKKGNENECELLTQKGVSKKRKQIEEAMKIANETSKNEIDNNSCIQIQQKNEQKDQMNEIKKQEKVPISQIEEQKISQESNIPKEIFDVAIEELKNNDFVSNEEIQNKQTEKSENDHKNEEIIEKNQNIIIEQTNIIHKNDYDSNIIKEDASFFKSIDDLEEFNDLNGDDQLSRIRQMQSNMSKQIYDKIVNLLTFLTDEIQNPKHKNFIFVLPNIIIDNDDKKESNAIIGISSFTTENLFKNGILNSSELSQHIDNFDEFYIEISYPSPHFKDIYTNVIKMKKTHQKNLKISIFITSTSTNQFFKGNCEINCIKFDQNVEKIASYGLNGSFEGCLSLSRVLIPSSSSIKSIGAYSFKGCLSLLSIKIPSSVNSIDDWSFSDCKSLIYVEIPSSVKNIGCNCFNGCNSLCRFENLPSLNSIKYGIFFNCCSLSSFEIPASVKVIESNAFEGCLNLKRIVIPSSVSVIEYSAFSGCCSLESISIPDSVESIGCCLFNGCSMLEKIVIPKKVKSIQHHCFADCKSLKNVTFQSSIECIGYNAFDGCSSLSEIEIPSSVKSIGFDAFANCSSLVQITIPSLINWYPIGIGLNVKINRI